MEQSTIRSNRWNEAARYGLVFGAISAVYLYLGHLQGILGLSGFFGNLIGFLLWAAKFTGCIMLMKHAMRQFAATNQGVTNSDTFKLGMLISMLSALVFAIVTVADQLYIFPEYYQGIYDIMLEEYAKILPADQMSQITEMIADMPKYSFFGQFIYCFGYGTVLSLILSRNIPSKDPFQNYKPDEQ